MQKFRSSIQQRKRFFDDLADRWDSMETEQSLHKMKQCIDGLPDVSGKRILDIGCGTGSTVKWLSERKAIVSGMDLSHNMILSCRTKFQGGCYVQADAHKIPWSSSSFDMVLCFQCLPHLTDLKTFIREVYRVLQDEGSFYIIHPMGRAATDECHSVAGDVVVSDILPSESKLREFINSEGFCIKEWVEEPVFRIKARKNHDRVKNGK
jgi:ubiquinone/menaquinone biosynthesis C-methylase UbiE